MRTASYVLALAIIIPAGIIQGRWTGRWSAPEAFDARVASIGQLNLKFGNWTGKVVEPEANTYERAGVSGGRMIRFENSQGDAYSVMLVCGRPGPTAVHTPEICYAGAGYEASSPKTAVSIKSDGIEVDELWTTDFLKADAAIPEYLRIYHGWSAGGPWHASQNPRLDFAGSKALYKLYVVRQMRRTDIEPDADPAIQFMQELLPQIRKVLQPSM